MSKPADASEPVDLGDVPLFPLPNVVLFPKSVQPLHIFEERYKVMTADALKGDRRVAMALLRPGWEKGYYARPAIEPVVCVGRILSAERLADGKYNILLQGVARAVVSVERTDDLHPYRVARLHQLPETDVDETDLLESRRRMLRLFERSQLALTPIGRQFRSLAEGPLATATLADLVAATYLEDLHLKQSLLAEQDVRCRVARVAEALEATQPVCQSAYLGDYANPTLN
jgi:Lon protease-like protein